MMRGVWAIGLSIVLCSVAGVRGAAAGGIGPGLNYLAITQEPAGLWGESQGTPFRDAAEAVVTLRTLGVDSAGAVVAANALNNTATSSTDYLARGIMAYTFAYPGNHVGVGDDALTSRINDLLARQNSDGGWGYNVHYGSNLLETALALHALKRAGYSNLSVLSAGVTYLTSRQNADKGWPFVPSDTSRVFTTSYVLFALESLRGSFSLNTQILNGIAWLKTQDHADGGFGTGATSNSYETALAVLAIAEMDSLASEVTNGRTHLLTRQHSNGSWDENAYNTALGIRALRNAPLVGVPPLTISTLAFAVAPNPARSGATVTLAFPRAEPRVELAIFDVTGRLVRALLKGEVPAGERSLKWDGRSSDGSRAASGTYFLRLKHGGGTWTRRLVLTH